MKVMIAWRPWVDLSSLVGFDQVCNLDYVRKSGLTPMGGKFTRLLFCSNFIHADANEQLVKVKVKGAVGVIGWLAKLLQWHKCVVLTPYGDPETKFAICYYAEGLTAKDPNECKAFPRLRQVKDGSFALRRAPYYLNVFIVSEVPVELGLHDYIDVKVMKAIGEELPELDLY